MKLIVYVAVYTISNSVYKLETYLCRYIKITRLNECFLLSASAHNVKMKLIISVTTRFLLFYNNQRIV